MQGQGQVQGQGQAGQSDSPSGTGVEATILIVALLVGLCLLGAMVTALCYGKKWLCFRSRRRAQIASDFKLAEQGTNAEMNAEHYGQPRVYPGESGEFGGRIGGGDNGLSKEGFPASPIFTSNSRIFGSRFATWLFTTLKCDTAYPTDIPHRRTSRAYRTCHNIFCSH